MKKALQQLLAADGVEVFHLFHLQSVTGDHLRRQDNAAGNLIASITGNHQEGFKILPVLADALEDAGWSDTAALRYLRKDYPRGRVLIATGPLPTSAAEWRKKFTTSTLPIAFRKPTIPMLEQVLFSAEGVGCHTFVSLTGAHMGQSVVETGGEIYGRASDLGLRHLTKRQYQAIPALRHLYLDQSENRYINVVTKDAFYYGFGGESFCLFCLSFSDTILWLDWSFDTVERSYSPRHCWLFGVPA